MQEIKQYPWCGSSASLISEPMWYGSHGYIGNYSYKCRCNSCGATAPNGEFNDIYNSEKEAKDIIVQLKAGANFAELANKKSLDENTEGGDLGYFTKAMMIPEFGDAVFDMKKGQLSGPIKTPFGWHVVLVEDKRLANPPSFEDLREDILRAAMETKLPMVLDEERAKLKVQILRPTLDTAP